MLSIEDCRKNLGKFGKNKSDEEIELIRNKLYSICEIIIDQVIKRKKNKTYSN